MKRKTAVFWMCLALTGLTLLFGGASAVHADDDVVSIRGKVFFDGPVAGATVSILDGDRNILVTQTNATDEEGRFRILIPYVPHRRIIIIARDGDVVKTVYAMAQDSLSSEREVLSVTETPFMAELARFIDDFDPEKEYPVNILSAILWDFWELGGQADFEEAEKILCDYLQLPGYLTVDDVIEYSSNGYDAYFNADYFLADMEELWEYTDYEDFMEFVVRNIEWFAEDTNEYSDLPVASVETRKWQYTIRRLPRDLAQSPLIKVGIAGAAVAEGAEFVFNIIGFGLNAIYKNLPETEEKRIMGTALSYLFEGGPDPVVTALFQNFEAIHTKLAEIQTQITDLHTYVEQKLTGMNDFLNVLPLIEPIANINGLKEDWKNLKAYKKEAGHLSQGAKERIAAFRTHVGSKVPGSLFQIQDVIKGVTSGKDLFKTWVESAAALKYASDKDRKYRTAVYEMIKHHFERLMVTQAMGRMFQVEVAMSKYGENNTAYAGEKTIARNTIQYLQDELKTQVALFEKRMEELALNFEWQLYSQAGAAPEIACPDFPMDSGDKGILSDVDRFVQKLVHGQVTWFTDTDNQQKEKASVPDMLTLRVVSPYNAGSESMGLVGVQSSVNWTAYKAHMKGMPSLPEAPPGQATSNQQFQYERLQLSPYIDTNDTSNLVDLVTPDPNNGKTIYPRVIEGRSPFELHDRLQTERNMWKYRLYKFRRFFVNGLGTPQPIQLKTKTFSSGGAGGVWHPNLTQGKWTSGNGVWEKPLPAIKEQSGTRCASYGLYGLKTPQKVRLMAYHARTDVGDDWWYVGWRSQDKGVLFANRQNAYTFFELWPLGNSWYVLRDSLGTSYNDVKPVSWPVYYTERSHYHAPEHRWVDVNPNRTLWGENNHLFADQQWITPFCAFKINSKKKIERRAHMIPPTRYTPIIWYVQPSTKLYTMKTFDPGCQTFEAAAEGKGHYQYLKWRWRSANWDRYSADGTDSDAQNNKDAWISIMPEYTEMVNYLLNF